MTLLIWLIVMLSYYVRASFDYEYHFYNNLQKNNISNEAVFGNRPYFINYYPDDRRNLDEDHRELNDIGEYPIWTRLGVMFNETALRSDNQNSETFPMGEPFTAIIWMYVTIIDQEGCLFGKVDADDNDKTRLCIFLHDGYLEAKTQTYTSSSRRDLDGYFQNNTYQSANSSFYSLGWNMISFTETSSTIRFRSAPNFGTLVKSSQSVNLDYRSCDHVILGAWRQDCDLSKFVTGIVHTLWVKDYDMSDSELQNYIAPRTNCATMCDYYVGYFTDFTTNTTATMFENSLELISGYSESYEFKYDSCTPQTDGLYIPSGKNIELKGRDYDDWVSVTYHTWFKGTIDDAGSFASTDYFMYVHAGGGDRPAYFVRNGNDLVLGTNLDSTPSINLSGAFSGYNSNEWAYFGISVGWLGDDNHADHVLCGYMYQDGVTDGGDCLFVDGYNGDDFDEGKEAKFKMENLQGHLKELYVLDYVQFPYLMAEYKDKSKEDRYNCRYSNEFYTEPGYFCDGCGNYVSLASESSETCDDGNTSNGDGCYANCTNEPLNTCTPNDLGASVCIPSCGDGILDSDALEECDDDDQVDGDGCDSGCQVEATHTCTDTEGDLSVCTPICGDGKVISPENCDDGDNTDGEGCNSNCIGFITGYFCENGTASLPSDCETDCGDSIIVGDEECDDNNSASNDGCSSSCTVETGWTCSFDSGLGRSVCSEECGDSKVVGSEFCDDGDELDADKCNSDCTGNVNGWACTGGDASTASTCVEDCGDNFITSGEECDDGDTDDGDGCDSSCMIETGWTCTNNTAMTLTTCTEVCGDSKVVGYEFCDDGDELDTDKCNSDCTANVDGWSCTGGGATTPSTCVEVCGDNFITAGEQCDDNNQDSLDGCDSSCLLENGWDCDNNTAMTLTTCTEICGDGLRVGDEICDDGDETDSIGCQNDCLGVLDGYNCENGTVATPDQCETVCGDGYFRGTEECDDNNTISGDGCDANCAIEAGFSCDNYVSTPSNCSVECGDGLVAGSETCDDGDNTDSKGCLNDCSGVIRGWYCTGGSPTTASTCDTVCGDEIHVVDEEECDDDNTVDADDGCTNSCTVEYAWSCRPNALQTSICTAACGNGFNDIIYSEECDDGNEDSGDGCDSLCKLEDGYGCINEDDNTIDQCYPQPTIRISDISDDNIFTITFSQAMVQFNPITDNDIEYWMTGPISKYKVTIAASFIDDYTLQLIVTTTTPFTGEDSEFLHIKLNTASFISQNGTTIYNDEVEGNTKEIPVYPDLVKAAGEGANAAMTTSVVTIISTNVALGQSSELLWGFINTIQIIYFMPLLSLYYPDHYSRFLTFLTSAKLQLDIFGIADQFPKSSDAFGNKLNMPALNSRYEDMEYESTSILLNADEMFTTVSMGIVTCILVFSFKAILITLNTNASPYQDMLEEIQDEERQENNDNAVYDFNQDSEREESKTKKKISKWIRGKLREMSHEYRYNFFIRLGLEVYLECSVLCLLNVRYSKFDNTLQFVSLGVATILIILCLYMILWTILFLKNNFNKMRDVGLERVARDVLVMFEDYKMTKWGITFNIFFFLRRFGYAILIIFGYELPNIQAIGFVTLMAVIFLYTVIVRPYNMSILNCFMVFNELVLLILGGCNFLFITPITSESKGQFLGWMCIGIIMGAIVLNLFYLIIMQIVNLVRAIKRVCNSKEIKEQERQRKTGGKQLADFINKAIDENLANHKNEMTKQPQAQETMQKMNRDSYVSSDVNLN